MSAQVAPHRRDVAIVFADLHGFTDFVDTSEPEFFFAALREHHDAMGAEIARADGTIVDMTADAIGVVFNDLRDVEDPAANAVRLALAMRSSFRDLSGGWRKRGIAMGLHIGVHSGFATLGHITLNDRTEYRAYGRAVHTAIFLARHAKDDQVLASERVVSAVGDLVSTTDVGEVAFRNMRPFRAFLVDGRPPS